MRDVRWQELTKQECFELLAGQILPTVLTGRWIALPEDAPWNWWG